MRRYFNTGARAVVVPRPAREDRRRSYNLNDLDAGFWQQVQRKAKGEGVSVRGKILVLLKAWVEQS